MDYDMISRTPLFQGISREEFGQLTHCLHMTVRRYRRHEVICTAGSTVSEIGLVLSGSVQIDNNDAWGNRSILNIVERGGAFAESYACLAGEPLLVNVVANEGCEVLFLDVPRLFRTCERVCACHSRLIRNLVTLTARKNLHLSQRIFLTSPKTIRGRLTAYFSQQIALQGTDHLHLPFDRQQLADYLNIDRSALSKELSKMKAEGLLDYYKNSFIIQKMERED